MAEGSASHYLKRFTVFLLGLLLTAGACNLLVDPFWLFDSPRLRGFNADKSQYPLHTRMEKAARVRQLKPAGLVLGTSRAEFGLDPRHPGWPAEAQPVYNLALSSGTIEEALRYLQHAQAIHPLKRVVLGADLIMFNARHPVGEGFREDRLAERDSLLPAPGWINDLFTSLFSFDALEASLETIRQQGEGGYVPYRSDGFREPGVNWRRIQAAGGHWAALVSNIRNSLTAEDGLTRFRIGDPAKGEYPPLDRFRELLRFCVREEISVTVVISPLHALKQEVIYRLGLWDEFEFWKRELTYAVSAYADQEGTQTTVELLDFSGYNPITTEPFPPPGDRSTRMRWYWEGSHYRKRTGDLVLDRVFGRDTDPELTASGFGVRLTAEGIDAHLAQIRRQRAAYLAAQPGPVAAIEKLIAETLGKRPRG